MNLAALDLNLLVALEALVGEAHVGRAARKVGLSQPAMSHALARLRALMNDPLLVHIAEADQFVPKAAQEAIVAALKDHPGVEIHTYPGRDHAFARKGGEHYDAADAGQQCECERIGVDGGPGASRPSREQDQARDQE